MDAAASEFLRALRGKRSQLALSRRLGYRGNPITDWERGERFPTGEEALRVASKVGIDVPAALASFTPQLALVGAGTRVRGRFDLAAWLDALRGTTSLSDVAERGGFSRFSVSRWLRGQAKPRLPELLRLIDSMTGRAPDWVATLVPIENVPSLAARHATAQAARRAAFEMPWTEAVLRLLETQALRTSDQVEPSIAKALDISLAEARACLRTLHQAGAVGVVDGHYEVRPSVSVDTQGGASALHRVKEHWSLVASKRLSRPRADELFAYNVVSVSRADLERIRERLRLTFREIRAIVAASQPEQIAAVMNLQLVTFDPE